MSNFATSERARRGYITMVALGLIPRDAYIPWDGMEEPLRQVWVDNVARVRASTRPAGSAAWACTWTRAFR